MIPEDVRWMFSLNPVVFMVESLRLLLLGDGSVTLDMFIGNRAGGLSYWKASFSSTLTWTGEANYITDGLNPETGIESDTFIYRINYTSSEDNAPKSGFPRIHILKGGIEISGSPFTMNEVNAGDTIYTDGKLYTYTKSGLYPGPDYTYYFIAYDLNDEWSGGVPRIPVGAPDVIGLSISGTITNLGNPMSGLIVSLSGDSNGSVQTETGGIYQFNYLGTGATYIITPIHIHYTFTPADRTYIDLSVDITDANFTAILKEWSIRGKITDRGIPIPGVTVTLSGDAVGEFITENNGTYIFSNLNAGSTYIITPKKKDYDFNPESYTAANLSGNIAQDFKKLFADDLSNIKVYPNPYKPGLGAGGIIFDNLTENTEIRIYTIEGKLVITILPDTINYQWNVKNESGNKLSSGVYLYIISNDKGEKKTGKLAVIK